MTCGCCSLFIRFLTGAEETTTTTTTTSNYDVNLTSGLAKVRTSKEGREDEIPLKDNEERGDHDDEMERAQVQTATKTTSGPLVPVWGGFLVRPSSMLAQWVLNRKATKIREGKKAQAAAMKEGKGDLDTAVCPLHGSSLTPVAEEEVKPHRDIPETAESETAASLAETTRLLRQFLGEQNEETANAPPPVGASRSAASLTSSASSSSLLNGTRVSATDDLIRRFNTQIPVNVLVGYFDEYNRRKKTQEEPRT